MNHVGDTYHEYIRGCSVPGKDILVTFRAYYEHIEGYSLNQRDTQ